MISQITCLIRPTVGQQYKHWVMLANVDPTELPIRDLRSILCNCKANLELNSVIYPGIHSIYQFTISFKYFTFLRHWLTNRVSYMCPPFASNIFFTFSISQYFRHLHLLLDSKIKSMILSFVSLFRQYWKKSVKMCYQPTYIKWKASLSTGTK